jgi:hypothetical protein
MAEGDNSIDASLDAAPEAVDDDIPSTGRASAISGMTAKTTFSMEEISELDTDVMLDSLKNLDSASEELLKVLNSTFSQSQTTYKALDDIATEGTKAHKLYQKRLSVFKLYKNDYTSANQDYIRPQNVSRALFDVSSIDGIPPGVMRPDSVLYKANLAQMLHVLLVRIRNPARSNVDIVEALEGLDHVFPKVIASPTFTTAAFQTSLALTTQLAINRMASFIEDPNFSPQGLAEHAFIVDSENDTPMYRHHFGLHLDELSEENRSMCLDRVNGIVTALKQPFDGSNEMTAIEALDTVRQTWPWVGFIEKNLFTYWMERKEELDKEISASGGIDNLDTSVKRAVQTRDELKRIASLTANLKENRRSSGKQQSLTADALQALKEFTPGPPTQAMAPVAQMTAPKFGIHASNNQFDQPSTMLPPGSSHLQNLSQYQEVNQTPRASAGRGRGRGRGKGKANATKSFNDRQSGAQRVEWEESQAQADLVPYESSVLGKHSRDADDEQMNHWEPTQDVGPQHEDEEDAAFETKASDNAAADARRLAAPTSFPQARPFLAQAPYFGTAPPPGSPGTPQRPTKRRNPGSSAPHPTDYPGFAQHQMDGQDPNVDSTQAPPSTSRAQEYHQAAWTARQYRILNPSQPARERRAWTDIETEALMTYINEWPEEDNLRYAVLKSKDTTDEGLHALQTRTAEDIRFRARNMKVNFLLARSQDVHPNWNKVQLAKKEIEKLHARGVPYAQAGLRGTPAGMDTGVGGSQE